MDPLTHGLTGALLAEVGPARQLGRQARVAMIAGALIPDIDVFWSTGGGVAELESHRGFTHSLLVALGLALVVGAVARASGPQKRFWSLAGLGLLGILVGHLFLDLATSFGTQILLPFTRERYAWDLVFIIDPLVSVPLMGALALPVLFRLSRVAFARAGLVYLVGYFALLATNHQLAVTQVRQIAVAQGLTPVRVAALPEPLTPFSWLGLVESDGVYGRAIVHPWSSQPVRLERIVKGPVQLTQALARQSREVQTYLWFARFPVAREREVGGKQVVEYEDLRFERIFRNRKPFRLRVILNRAGVVERVLLNPT